MNRLQRWAIKRSLHDRFKLEPGRVVNVSGLLMVIDGYKTDSWASGPDFVSVTFRTATELEVKNAEDSGT